MCAYNQLTLEYDRQQVIDEKMLELENTFHFVYTRLTEQY